MLKTSSLIFTGSQIVQVNSTANFTHLPVIYITNEICLSVCLSVPPRISETVRPRMMKLYMRNLHTIWKISTEKNFGKIEKKNFEIFPGFFSKFFFRAF